MWLKNLFLANWRTKAIALFFSVSIWFVAYQSEAQRSTLKYRVRFEPREPGKMAIVGFRRPGQTVSLFPPSGELEVEVTIEGPREQVDEIRAGSSVNKFVIQVEKDDSTHEFKQDDFGFPRDGVSASNFQPKRFLIEQSVIEERTISALKSIVEVPNKKSDDKVNVEVDGPEGGLRIRGPVSVLDEVGVKVTVPMNFQGRADGLFDLRIQPDTEKVKQTVQIFKNFDLGPGVSAEWVWFTDPVRIHVSAVLEERLDMFSVDRARLLFQLPLLQAPCRVTLKDVPLGTETIPVAFEGSRKQVQQIRDLPEITLIVPPPAEFDAEKGGTFNFIESDLKVKGFPGVNVLQHESRKEQQASFWSYEIKMLGENESKKE
jgi:hypothetical protein